MDESGHGCVSAVPGISVPPLLLVWGPPAQKPLPAGRVHGGPGQVFLGADPFGPQHDPIETIPQVLLPLSETFGVSFWVFGPVTF